MKSTDEIAEPGPTIETERLCLRPVSDSDLEDLYRIFIAPGVRRYLLDDDIVSRDWVEAEIRASRKRFADLGVGIWAVFPKDSDTLAGFCGFRFFHEPPELQLLYGISPAYWTKGLATEASRAVMRYAFQNLGFDEIVAGTDAPNTASIRVMGKLGMKFEKRTTIGGSSTVYYKTERRDFRPGGDFYKVHP